MSQGLNLANQDLRDRSFKGKNLIGADFSGADIRGCNFCRSQLKSADFTNVITGQSQRQKAIASIITFVMALMFAGTTTIATIVLITFTIAFIFGMAIVNRQTVYWVAIVAIVVFAVGFAIAFTTSMTRSLAIVDSHKILTIIPISLITAFGSGYFGSTFTKILVYGAFNTIARLLDSNIFVALLTLLAIAPLQIFGSLYLFRVAINMSQTNTGTRFQYADLTQASFHRATLVSCDFSNAIMHDVNWQQAQMFHCKFPPNFKHSV